MDIEKIDIKKIEFGEGKHVFNLYLTLDLIPIHVIIKYDFEKNGSINIFNGKLYINNESEFIDKFYTLKNYQIIIDELCLLLNLEKRQLKCTYKNKYNFNFKEDTVCHEYQFTDKNDIRYYTEIKIDKAIQKWKYFNSLCNNKIKEVKNINVDMISYIKYNIYDMNTQNVFNYLILNFNYITNYVFERYINDTVNIIENTDIKNIEYYNKIQTFIIGDGSKYKDIYFTLDLIPIHIHLKYNDNNTKMINFIDNVFTIQNYQILINFICDYLGLEKRELCIVTDLPKFNIKNDTYFYEYQYFDDFDNDYFTKSKIKNVFRIHAIYNNLFSNENISMYKNNDDIYKLISQYYKIFDYVKNQKIFTRNDSDVLSDNTSKKFKKYLI